ncbi:deoxyuridine 5'-triphosphate nucleotidohydrolase [Tepidamorphus gemmatus]|jgi:dUTP pyrophosphatase|uniref:Deoxyuridine 5'-triphosphate nucleotidohydrolase n=1 Tax=Tepidamorphus gemmatus TaxID=747076 RepID=A0A4R3MFR3_9HYPH|nr:dUTP diphosphatase [Tepidamorphus gemmatus]TCT12002.1 deoxyuridine 5'-triphosphate nucleotidohydrolase [Tepidamorphus gemmatus]
MSVTIRVLRLAHGADMPLPDYGTAGAAGLDLRAAVETPLMLGPGERTLVPTGLIVEIPEGFEGQVRPRSGLAARHGVTVLNAPGTIDSDYRGEVKVILVNHGDAPISIGRGDRIAQLVVAPVSRVRLIEVDALGSSIRGAGGFGSTGR